MVVSSSILTRFFATAKFEFALDYYASYASVIYLGGDMFSRQNNGQNGISKDRFLQFFMVIAAAVAAFAYYILFKFLFVNDNSISGELVLNSNLPTTNTGSPVLGFFFSYFGAFVFVLPLVFVYCVYLILKNRNRWLVPDFFKIGLRILGFNFLVLGMCTAFSRMFSFMATGGGGVLGDYLNLSLLSMMSGVLVSLCSLIVTFVGICVFVAKSPLFFADAIGSFVCSFFGNKEEAVESEQEMKAAPVISEVVDNQEHIEPAFEEEQLINKSAGVADSSIFANVMNKDRKVKSAVNKNEEMTVASHNMFDREEPKFSDFEKEKEPQDGFFASDDFLPDEDLLNQKFTADLKEDERPHTIITREEDRAKSLNSAKPQEPEKKEPTTIITKGYTPVFETSLPQVEAEKEDEISTFISHGSGTPRDDFISKIPVNPDPATVSTHIFSGEKAASFNADTALPEESFTSADDVNEEVNESFKEENVIQFSDFAKKSSFEVENLPASFLPSAQDDEADGNLGLSTPAHTLSEKDGAYQYENATRGVISDSITSPKEGNAGAEKVDETADFAAHSFAKEPESVKDFDSSSVQESSLQENVDSNSGFIGQAHNSSSSNLPSYMTKAPEEKSFMPQITPSTVTVPHHKFGLWRPSFDLLTPSHNLIETRTEDLEEMARKINSCLVSFRIKAQVARFNVGPIITRYDLLLAPGTKTATIANLSQDLCRELMVSSVRVVGNIPGTQYVGLEVPNPKRKMITLRDMADAGAFNHAKGTLPICLGSSVTGEPIMVDLAAAPHLLISGTTGSGKSAGLNCFLISLLMQKSPEELRLILIDPKRIEFSLYNNLPHLITPVISDVAEKTSAALRWCIDEMERRYALIEAIGVRKISEYNELIEQETAAGRKVYDPAWTADMGGEPPVLAPLPSIVIVIEEYADLLAQTSGRKKNSENSPENSINRLAAKARAAGMHIILATQTPRADVVTGVIKANMPSRVAFTVQSKLDSTIILDEQGAEKLLGYGDMLCKFNGVNRGQTFRAHGAFLSNEDVERVVDAWKEHGGEPDYIDGVTDVPEEDNDNDDFASEPKVIQYDKYFDQAAAYTREYYARKQKYPSISDFQSTFGVGYPRAKKIVAQLIREGVMED